MKTPKANVGVPKNKLNTSKLGKVSKQLGSVSNKNKSKIPLKNAEHALNALIKDSPSEIKVKNNKSSSALIGAANKNAKTNKNVNASPSPNKNAVKQNISEDKSPKLSKKAKKNVKSITGSSPANPQERVTIVKNEYKKKNKKPQISMPPSSKVNSSFEENNSSPLKKIKGNKTVKLPFGGSPPTLKEGKVKAVGKELNFDSPGSKSGNSIQAVLSPKAKKLKKKKPRKNEAPAEGTTLVSKQEDAKENSSPANNEKSGKKKKRRRRRSKSQNVEDVTTPSLLNPVNVKNALSALLQTLSSKKSDKKELFNEERYILLQLNLLKGSSPAKGVLHIPLPNLILPASPDVLLITPDLKGKRNDPEEAIDHYKELLNKNNIDFVSEIIPIRQLKKDYSQFEEKTKLANRFDAILVDGRVNKMARIGRRFARSKKCVSAVKLECNNLKNEFQKALRKVAVFSSGTGNSFSIKCGRIGMSANDICENIVEIGKVLAMDKIVVGDKKNINSIYVKTALSNSFPIYVSAVSPNEVPVPKGKERKQEKPVRDEVTTVEGADVIVYPSGAVKVKKRKNENIEPEEDGKKDSPKAPKKAKTQTQNKQQQKKPVMESDNSDTDDSDSEPLSDDDMMERLRRLEALSDQLNTRDDSDGSSLGSSDESGNLTSDDEAGNESDDMDDDDDNASDDSSLDESDEENVLGYSETEDSDDEDDDNDDDFDGSSDGDIKEYEKKYINQFKKLQQLEAGIKESETTAAPPKENTTTKANKNKKNKEKAATAQKSAKPSKSNVTTVPGAKISKFQKKPRVVELTKGPKKAK